MKTASKQENGTLFIVTLLAGLLAVMVAILFAWSNSEATIAATEGAGIIGLEFIKFAAMTAAIIGVNAAGVWLGIRMARI